MKIALILAYVAIGVLAVIVVFQQISIQKLTPAPAPASGSGGSGSGEPASGGRFGDMVKAVQQELQPKEINVKF